MDTRRTLRSIRIPSPCAADWRQMRGDDRARFCDRCQKTVYNLSAMSQAEAEALLNNGEPICAGFNRRADGTVLTRDQRRPLPISMRQWLRSAWASTAGLIAMFLGLTGFLFPGCAGSATDAQDRPQPVGESFSTQLDSPQVSPAGPPTPSPFPTLTPDVLEQLEQLGSLGYAE